MYHDNFHRYISSLAVHRSLLLGEGGGRGGSGGKKEGNDRGAIVGHLMATAKPIREKSHKWYVSPEEFAGDFYPEYILGGVYLISGWLRRCC